jgi:glycosyltransferase involved in cell wall biosynthesis
MERANSVSVIVPVFNGERYIREALQSILAQEYDPLEILVVDDGSADNIATILPEEFPSVRYHHQEHAGLSAARNFGLALASGRWVGFLDSDDLWAPGKIRRQMDYLGLHLETEAVFGHIRQFYTPDEEEKVRQAYRYSQEVLPGFHPDTMLISADAVRRVGAFDPRVEMGEFLDWFARAKEAALVYAMLPDVLAFRRIHQSNMSITRRGETASEYARLLKAALDRRRKGQS